MVSKQEIIKQLKKIDFKHSGWGRSEVAELPHIILPDEEIYECVNGIYEGGFALLVATDVRVLLVDKKPLNYLTVEDMRFDMISQMDYSHRIIGAEINIAAGDKALHFRSYNQERLRKLIGHVQHCMAEAKKQQTTHQEGQVQHLEQINRQLQSYLVAQQQYQLQLQKQTMGSNAQQTADFPEPVSVPEPPKPSSELADFLYAQSLLAQHQSSEIRTPTIEPSQNELQVKPVTTTNPVASQQSSLYEDGLKEIFGESLKNVQDITKTNTDSTRVAIQNRIISVLPSDLTHKVSRINPLEINPIQIAYSKLPMVLRNRKFGRPSMTKPSRPGIKATHLNLFTNVEPK